MNRLTNSPDLQTSNRAAIEMLRGDDVDTKFGEVHQELLTATSKGRGNSEWLSFSAARRIVTLAEDAGPEVASRLKDVLAAGLKSGKVGDNNLILGGRALELLTNFTGTDPSVYLAIAGDKAKAAQVASLKARGLGTDTSARNVSSYETATPTVTPKNASAFAALVGSFSSGLRSLGKQAQVAPAGRPQLANVDEANAFAKERLGVFAKDLGLDLDTMSVSVSLSRSMFEPSDFKNQSQLHRGIDAVAAFAARLNKDAGDNARLDVVLIPDGKMERSAGTDADNLFVPVNKKHTEISLRKGFDDGEFIRPDNRFNPLDHLATAKKRKLWQLVGNPASELRVRMRRLMGEVSLDLGQGISKLLDAKSGGKLDDNSFKDAAKALVSRFVSPEATSASGGNAQEDANAMIDDRSVGDVEQLLGRWRDEAISTKSQEEIGTFAAQKSGSRIKDSRNTFGLINVDTYDAVTVAPAGVLDRHGKAAIGEVELSGTRVGLINVSSTDVVTVVPDLARMLLGGVSLERASS